MTLPRFTVDMFPIETAEPRIEVVLPVGEHILELVVIDSAGLLSEPARVSVTVQQSEPVITQILPIRGTQGSRVTAEIQGQNLLGITQVSFSPPGVTASILPGGTDTQVQVELTIAQNATVGPRSFSVTTPGGTVDSPAGVEFTVQQAAPEIQSISPTRGTQGTQSLQVTISGQNLSGAQDVTFSGTGVTLNRIISSNATSVVADIAIAANAPPGDRSFSVTTPGGQDNSPPRVEFTVQQAAPVITGINPNSVTPGTQATVTIAGSNLAGVSQVAFSGSGITVDRISGSSNTSVSVNLTVDANAAPGDRTFTVTTPGGTANSPSRVVLTVQQAPTPVISLDPASGPLEVGSIDIKGSGFTPSSRVEINLLEGTRSTTTTVNSDNNGSWQTTLQINVTAAPGEYPITATDANGFSASATFIVDPPGISMAPASGAPGTQIAVSGTGFTRFSPISIDLDGNSLLGSRTLNTDATGTFNAADVVVPQATPGLHTLTATDGAGNSASASFRVEQSAPTIVSIQPDRGFQGTTIDAAVRGTNLGRVGEITFADSQLSGSVADQDGDLVLLKIAIGRARLGAHTFSLFIPPRTGVDSGDFRVTFTVLSSTQPTIGPTIRPTISPTIRPTISPTIRPTISPTISPTIRPTIAPTLGPTISPTISPTLRPTISPTIRPTVAPITRVTTAPISPTISRTTISRLSASSSQPVDEVSGIGPTFRSRLEAGGITTVNDLANAQPAEVARLIGTTEVRAMSFIEAARELASQ